MSGLLEDLPPRVRVVEVGPRDGLQNRAETIPTELKVEWIRRLAAAGISEIEATSFVHPRWVPQLADGADVMQQLIGDDSFPDNVALSALVPNLRGLEGALEAGVRNIAVFAAASETFSRRNTNCSIAESIERIAGVFSRIEGEEIRVRAYISTCFGCPYEGDVPVERVVGLTRQFLSMGAAEIGISDTTGVASPTSVKDVVQAVTETVPVQSIALHLHDTRGLALTNTLTGLQLGVTTFDASSGGLGGCPYAPGAAGNLATEDLVTLLHSLGIETGIDLDLLIAANLWFETHFDESFPGRVLASRRSSADGPESSRT